jgi:MFS-type transporter involved in bile tolerance (Atg22 family)
MKGMLRNKKSLMISSILVVMAIAVVSVWQYRNAQAIRIESTGDYFSIGMSLAPPQVGQSEGPMGAYSGSVVAEKSPNYYEIDYPGSSGNLNVGDGG